MNPTTKPHPSNFFPDLKQCHSIPHLKQLHAQMIKTGIILNPLAAPELLRVSALSPHRDLSYTRLIFRHMDTPNLFSWNTIIRALAESPLNERSNDDGQGPSEALAYFYDMLCDDFVEPNRFTFPSVLKACALTGRVREGKQVHAMVVKYGLGFDEFVSSNLVRMYVMCGYMSDAYILFKNVGELGNVVLWNVMMDGYIRVKDFISARKLFDEMPERSVVSWNSIISGFAQNGYFREAVELFRYMQSDDISPNYVSLVSVLPAISRLGALELGKWVHLYAEKNDIRINAELGSALIDMYSKCGNVEKVIRVFEGLPHKNVITWNAVIGGLAMHGRAKEALDFFKKMGREGVSPSDVTYISILSACSHSGLVNEGKLIFDHMVKNSGLEPRIEHYGCMVDLLGRAGLLQEAENLISEMPFKPDDVALKALLGACKMHKNIEMGERIARRLMEMAPNDSGAYVALSNMYASLGDWEEVVEVRMKMKEMDIRKDPGCSYIEIDGTIHEFLVQEDKHCKAKEIDLMLKEINNQIRSLGYRPNITQVYLNMDDEERESELSYHSEKIAVAFGLISTSPGTTLRVVKNLRICDDCHSSMKLISKIYKRTIIVRDRKRFHHFENGECSCNEYW